jgi:hypothetical protein
MAETKALEDKVVKLEENVVKVAEELACSTKENERLCGVLKTKERDVEALTAKKEVPRCLIYIYIYIYIHALYTYTYLNKRSLDA